MSATADREAARTSAAVADVVERVFATVDRLQGPAVRSLGGAGPWLETAPPLDELVEELLAVPGQLAVGLGLVAAPDGAVHLRWWQAGAGAGPLRALEPDLDPGSAGYYDCTSAEWFAVPRSTGRRHVVGPYVDVHGTGRYVLTLTSPVVVGGEFVGVVGADLPVDRFETHLLERLGPVREPFVLLADDGRVVLSTAGRWLVGDLVRDTEVLQGPGLPVPAVPWRLHVVTSHLLLLPG